jgi:hypothetical protein
MTTITTQIEAGDANTTFEMTSPEADAIMRRTASDLHRLWVLCGKPACRRARRCRRDPDSCLRGNAPLAPEDARVDMLLTMEAARDYLSRDELRANAPVEAAALDAWVA